MGEAWEYSPEPDFESASPGAHIWGWTLPAELDWLAARAAESKSVAEIGSLHGRSTFALLTGCRGLVYSIDPATTHSRLLANLAGFENLVPILVPSPEAAELVPDVDLVFLDGAHDRRSVVADIDAWLPKTRVLLCGHDYNHEGYPDVRAVVDESFGSLVGVAPETSIWFVEIAEREREQAGLP